LKCSAKIARQPTRLPLSSIAVLGDLAAAQSDVTLSPDTAIVVSSACAGIAHASIAMIEIARTVPLFVMLFLLNARRSDAHALS
jgi:hypothetical protein